jgi:hypothetical protein
MGGNIHFKYKTEQEAIDAAWDEYSRHVCEDLNPSNGESFNYTMYVVHVNEIWVEYEHYHGDRAEHELTMEDLL